MDEPQVPAVRNAADRSQVGRAGRRERDEQQAITAAWREVLRTKAGRVLIWHLLSEAGVFRSIWHASALIHYLAGKQDFGHQIMAEAVAADEDAFDLMQREARARGRAERNERMAVQQRAVTAREEE